MALERSLMNLMQTRNDIRGNKGKRVEDRSNKMSRYIGGHNRLIHPYVSGYWYMIMQIPSAIFKDTSKQRDDELWLHSSVETFNPPSRIQTKVDVPGIGGLGASFVAGQQLTRTFSMEFREYQDTPLTNLFERWVSVVDPHYGVSHLGADEYIPSNYKGNAFVMLCKPTLQQDYTGSITVDDVERFYYFEGVFPEGMPDDIYSSDISTNDVARVNISFSFDGWPVGKKNKEIFEEGISLFNDSYQLTYEEQNHHTTVTATKRQTTTQRMFSANSNDITQE